MTRVFKTRRMTDNHMTSDAGRQARQMNKFLFKWLITMLSAALLTCVACQDKKGSDRADITAPARPATTELVFWHPLQGPAAAALEEAVMDFDKSRDDLTVKIEQIPRSENDDRIERDIPGGNGPDVFVAADTFARLWIEKQHLIEPIDQFTKKSPEKLTGPAENYQERYLTRLSSEDLVYGLPLAVRVPLLVADPDVVTRGYVIRAEPGANSAQPLAFDETDWLMTAGFLPAFGGAIVDGAGMPVFDSDNSAMALDFVARQIQGGGIIAVHGPDALIESFNRGSIPAILVWPEYVPMISKARAWVIMPMPGIEKAGRMTPWWQVDSMFLASWSHNKKAGADLILWLADPERQNFLARSGFPGLSVTSHQMSAEYDDSKLSEGIRQQQTLSVASPDFVALRTAMAAFSPKVAGIISAGNTSVSAISTVLKPIADNARQSVTKLMQSSSVRLK